jgi:hypothetical protein
MTRPLAAIECREPIGSVPGAETPGKLGTSAKWRLEAPLGPLHQEAKSRCKLTERAYVHVSLSTTYKGKLRRTPVWVLRYRLGSGKQSRQVLGPAWTKKGRPAHGHLTEEEARMKAQAFSAEHATDTPDARRSFRAALDLFVRYCTQEKGLRGSTMHEYRKIGKRLAARPWRGELTWAERPLARSMTMTCWRCAERLSMPTAVPTP